MDYYLVPDRGAVLVEEFTHAADHTTTGLDSAAWSAVDGWWSSAAFARGLRTDPALRARVVPATREEAAAAYDGPFPDEPALRGRFTDHLPLTVAPPLRLRPDGPLVYRLVFAGADTAPPVRPAGDGRVRCAVRRLPTGAGWCVDVTADPSLEPHLGVLLESLRRGMRRHGLIPVAVERLG